MYKKVKKLNLNTSDKAHGKLLIKNLFTSLLINGKIKTTEKKAKELKKYAQEKISDYINKIIRKEPIYKKTWLQQNILGNKLGYKRAVDNLKALNKGFKITIHRVGFRAGDGALLYEVELINSEAKENE